MTHRQLRGLAVAGALIMAVAVLPGCSWNPFQPSPGGVSFQMTADGVLKYENNGRDIDAASGDVTFPNGARGKFKIAGSRGSSSTDNAVNAQAQLNALLIALLGQKIPNLGAILAAGGVLPVPSAVP